MPYLYAANITFQKLVYFAVGGFDQRFRGAEDLDLAIRLVDKGYKISVVDIKVGIPLNTRFATTFSRQAQYRKGREALFKLNPIAGKYLPKDEFLPVGFKRWIYKPFSWNCWVLLVDRNFFTFLPKKIRFKLYDVIMTVYLLHG